MASAPSSQPLPSAEIQAFAAEHYAESGAARFGMDQAGVAALLAEVAGQRCGEALPAQHLEELVLARACMAGDNHAWEVFLTRYRAAMYEAAYKIARDEATGRALADSLYAELYGVNEHGDARSSKLRYYQGRGSLAGWLRTVIAQEYVNQYRRTKRETSLDAAVEEGLQFEAKTAETPRLDTRVEEATAAELAALPADERLILSAYYLDGRTLAEIARLLRVHESTISRRLERTAAGLRKRIRKRLIAGGMGSRQADEALEETDVRDLRVKVGETLRQDGSDLAFYKKSGEEG